MPRVAVYWIAAAVGILLAWLPWQLHAAIDERTRLALEALSRLKDSDLEASPGLKQAVLKVLEQVRGEPEFVDLVRDFRLLGQEAELLRFATRQPSTPQTSEALRLVLAATNAPGVAESLHSPSAAALIEVLGATGDPRAVRWLMPLVTESALSLEVRGAAIRALAKSSEGATTVLAQSKEGVLPAELRAIAAAELRTARWPEIRTSAALIFPAKPTSPATALPPLAELVQMKGDPAKGLVLFRRRDIACSTCHQVDGEGIDFGPKLSEIGSKLGPVALITSILEPSDGISFGFEAWRIELKNGEELFGLVVSDAEEELAVKQSGGLVQRVKKNEVVGREKQTLSIMPDDLEQSLSAQEFVDLIAYLSSLKKPVPSRP